ncbi:MAG: serpin family protein [Candidatus Eisenbacteria bacterium]
MCRGIRLLLPICILVSIVHCADNSVESVPEEPRQLTASEQELVQAFNKFGLDLFREIILLEKDMNVFISPLSVSMSLGMALNGAAGATQEAMKTTLAFSDMTMEDVNESYQSLIGLLSGLDPEVRWQLANSIWFRDAIEFEHEFFDACSTYFDATVRGLDFNDPDAADTINNWVKENTNDRITEIVDKPVDPMMVMFLINAIYFKGTWVCQFDPERTLEDLFYLPDGSTLPCMMMAQEESHCYEYLSNSRFEALDLPYGNGLFSMTIILPGEGVTVNEVIGQLSAETWQQWMDGLHNWTGMALIPRFELEYDLNLGSVLSGLGMEIAFDPLNADFTGMFSPGGIFISEVKHKTFVKVNEEGTEAAAVTSTGAGTSSGPPVFYARRPFVFAIREKHSNTILFIGKIVDPGFDP